MIHGLLVMKDESDRFLGKCLSNIRPHLDTLTVYDDQSTDDSVFIASQYGTVHVRPDSVPSFLQDEGGFRWSAWNLLEGIAKDGDGILVFDADEFYVGDVSFEGELRFCNNNNYDGVSYRYREVFDSRESLKIRTDGFWGNIWANRLCLYRGPSGWKPGMACGSMPTYAKKMYKSKVDILHFGYFSPEDVSSKYTRYSSINHNHNSKHIQSIIAKPILEAWGGNNPLSDTL